MRRCLSALVLFALAGLAAAGAGAQDRSGSVIFAGARGILELNLATRELSVLVPSVVATSFPTMRGGTPESHQTRPMPMQIHHSVVAVDDNRFLFTERREQDAIKEFDRRTGSAKRLHAGHVAAYLPGVQQILFFTLRADGSGHQLETAELDNIQNTRRILLAGPVYADGTKLIAISPSEVVVQRKPKQLTTYDLANGNQQELTNPNCDRLVLWDAEASRLLCLSYGGSGYRYMWTDLDGKHVQEHARPAGFTPLLCVDQCGAMLGYKTRITSAGEVNDIWLAKSGGTGEVLLERLTPFSPVLMR